MGTHEEKVFFHIYTVLLCNALQHTAAKRSTLQHTTTHYDTLQRTATHCSALWHTAAHCGTLKHWKTLQHCNTLQHMYLQLSRHTRPVMHSYGHMKRSCSVMFARCNALQHCITATRCHKLQRALLLVTTGTREEELSLYMHKFTLLCSTILMPNAATNYNTRLG